MQTRLHTMMMSKLANDVQGLLLNTDAAEYSARGYMQSWLAASGVCGMGLLVCAHVPSAHCSTLS